MLYVCVRDVMDVVFPVCILWRVELYVFVYGKYECFVMQMLYVYVLCASCGGYQCCILHDLPFVNAGRGCKRRPYERGILQRWSHDCLIGSHECLLLFTASCCSECFYHL